MQHARVCQTRGEAVFDRNSRVVALIAVAAAFACGLATSGSAEAQYARTHVYAAKAPATKYDPPPAPWAAVGAKAVGGPDGFGYTFADQDEPGVTYSFVDISGTGTPVGLNGTDDAGSAVSLGAPFTFYGAAVGTLYVSSNGFLSDTGTDIDVVLNDCPLPGVTAGSRILALHDDLGFFEAGAGDVYYQYFAVSPVAGHDPGAIVQPASVFLWNNVHHYGDTTLFDFEVVLFHTTGEIFVQIAPGNPEHGAGSTTGIQSGAGLYGLTYACNTVSSVPDGTAVSFIANLTPSQVTVFSTDFETGLSGFTIDNNVGSGNGLWHLTTACSAAVGSATHTTPTSLYFGQNGTCDYDAGTAVGGTATSPVVSLPAGESAYLRFKYYLVTEAFVPFDKATVSISVNGGAAQIVASNQGMGVPLSEGATWQSAVVNLGPLLASKATEAGSLRMEFRFDSVDDLDNAHAGFYVDDVEVTVLSPALRITSTPVTTAVANQAYAYNIVAVPIDPGDTLTFTAFPLPDWLTLTDHGDGTAVLWGTPNIFDLGSYPVQIRVDDQNSNSDTQNVEIEVARFANPVVNFGFETGDLTGWTLTDIANPLYALSVAGPGLNLGNGLFTSAPPEGAFAAVHGFDGAGPGSILLEQEVAIPNGAVRLSFDYRAGWDLLTYGATLDRTFSVVIEDTAKSVLQSNLVLAATAGTFVSDTGGQVGSIDVSAFAGQTVTIVFKWSVPEDTSGPGFFQLDNVRIVGAPELPAGRGVGWVVLACMLAMSGIVTFAALARRTRLKAI